MTSFYRGIPITYQPELTKAFLLLGNADLKKAVEKAVNQQIDSNLRTGVTKVSVR